MDGRSLIQWSERDDRTAEKDRGGNGRGDVSGMGSTVRMCDASRELKGRSSSRWRSVEEESADVSEVSRVESGADPGLGTVSARAMLHAFAPRSSTEGNCRFMS